MTTRFPSVSSKRCLLSVSARRVTSSSVKGRAGSSAAVVMTIASLPYRTDSLPLPRFRAWDSAAGEVGPAAAPRGRAVAELVAEPAGERARRGEAQQDRDLGHAVAVVGEVALGQAGPSGV